MPESSGVGPLCVCGSMDTLYGYAGTTLEWLWETAVGVEGPEESEAVGGEEESASE